KRERKRSLLSTPSSGRGRFTEKSTRFTGQANIRKSSCFIHAFAPQNANDGTNSLMKQLKRTAQGESSSLRRWLKRALIFPRACSSQTSLRFRVWCNASVVVIATANTNRRKSFGLIARR